MKLNKRAIILIAGIVALIVIISVIIGVRRKNNDDPGTETRYEGNTRIITGDKLSSPKNYNNLEFTNVSFQIDEDTTEISAEVRNTSSTTTEKQYIDFNVFDKDGNKIATIGGYVVPLEPGATTKVSTTRLTEENDAKAYNVEVVPQQESQLNTLPEDWQDILPTQEEIEEQIKNAQKS